MEINKRAFSLIEIALVLVILSILTALLAPQLLETLQEARFRQATSQAMDLKKIILQYQIDPLMKRDALDRGKFTKNNPASEEITLLDLIQHGYLMDRPINPWNNYWSLEVKYIGSGVSPEAYLNTLDGSENKLSYYVGKE